RIIRMVHTRWNEANNLFIVFDQLLSTMHCDVLADELRGGLKGYRVIKHIEAPEFCEDNMDETSPTFRKIKNSTFAFYWGERANIALVEPISCKDQCRAQTAHKQAMSSAETQACTTISPEQIQADAMAAQRNNQSDQTHKTQNNQNEETLDTTNQTHSTKRV
ncbi:hypothetical protein L0F63_002553, partial [Massospora cicadina]